MGTRSLTYVYDNANGNDDAIICMYRQFDGYPGGHGQELAEFLNSGKMVNGYSSTSEKQFNGMGCLAAQMVAHFKKDVGGFYLYPTKQGQDAWQEYEYHVWEDKVRIDNPDDIIFEGSWEEFEQFCLNPVEA